MLRPLVQHGAGVAMGAMAVLAFLLLAIAPTHAQSLPDWAQPAQPTPYGVPEHETVVEDLLPLLEEEWMVGPELPDVPPPVPVDGGLGLLALAGAAYAVRRLRRSA
ncbi:MAG: hypothetical protein AAF624_07810 [Bacteroidota bacterium]